MNGDRVYARNIADRIVAKGALYVSSPWLAQEEWDELLLCIRNSSNPKRFHTANGGTSRYKVNAGCSWVLERAHRTSNSGGAYAPRN